ncbi:MAG: methyltransferase domain-containing protein [Candidatus Saccharimonadaceae bacterium]
MPTGFEVPSRDALIAEQATVQAEKFQGRLIAEYNGYIFPGQSWREPRGSAVADFVRPIIGNNERVTLDGVLEGLIEAKAGESVHWVDMGGGRALTMRQLGSMPDFKQRLKMTNVDLFDFGLEGLGPDELDYLEGLVPGMTDPSAEPTLITDNVETVQLSEPADIITSIEVIQYLNDPLEAISNWYNQLADNGIMLVATEHDWSGWVRYTREPGGNERDETPMKHLLEELTRAGINCAVTDKCDWQSGLRPDVDPDRVRIMAVQKKPGTALRVIRPVVDVWVNLYNFKSTFYEAPGEESSPIVKVANTETPKALGAITLGNIS